MKSSLILVLACAAGLIATTTNAYPRGALALPGGQSGPPNAPPSTAPPSAEPVVLHQPRPPLARDFQGKPEEVKPQKRFDAVKARKDAEELVALADKVRGEVDQLSKGVLAKDLAQQLKEIQKLAKRLRGETTP